MKSFKSHYNEAIDSEPDFASWDISKNEVDVEIEVGDFEYKVSFMDITGYQELEDIVSETDDPEVSKRWKKGVYEVDFKRIDKPSTFKLTGDLKNSSKVFGAIAYVILETLSRKKDIKMLMFSAEEKNRISLYSLLVRRILVARHKFKYSQHEYENEQYYFVWK